MQRITPHSWSWNWAHGGCDRSTGDDCSLRHLIPPLVYPGVRVSLILTVLWIVPFTWSGHWFWMRISSVYLISRTDFDCGFFCLPNVDTLILTNGFTVWNGAHLIPPPAGPGSVYLTCNSYLCFETDYSLVSAISRMFVLVLIDR
jgi:hypothetical protein